MREQRMLIRKVLCLKLTEKSNTSCAIKSEINNRYQRCLYYLIIILFNDIYIIDHSFEK